MSFYVIDRIRTAQPANNDKSTRSLVFPSAGDQSLRQDVPNAVLTMDTQHTKETRGLLYVMLWNSDPYLNVACTLRDFVDIIW